ncbi:MAG: D-amino acid dehydrogenase [Magnetovibrio sp.]|nr:D-amino acid dehydrogenase [Magnetovibrio sp.]
MKIIVLGAGIIGVTTAYELSRDGHEVIVVEQREDVGLETSFANGGQLAANHAEPWAAPGTISKALRWLGQKEAPLLYRLRLDPALWAWTLEFLGHCSEPRFWQNVARILRVALYSRDRFKVLRNDLEFDFDLQQRGILNIFRDDTEYEQALIRAQAMTELGCERKAMDAKSCIRLEPALAHSTQPLFGGTWSPHDESGNCFVFTQKLAAKTRDAGVCYQFNTQILGLESDGTQITAVRTNKGVFKGDQFVLAMGCNSQKIAKALGLKLHIYPAKGYSVSLPITHPNSDEAPQVSLTDDRYKLVFSRFGDTFRAAGTAEFSGYNTDVIAHRAQLILDTTLNLFPNLGDPKQAVFWAGLRPATPDGAPLLGRGQHENLLLNTGHGTLGWTMAAGSARIIADLAQNKQPEIDMDGLGPERFR